MGRWYYKVNQVNVNKLACDGSIHLIMETQHEISTEFAFTWNELLSTSDSSRSSVIERLPMSLPTVRQKRRTSLEATDLIILTSSTYKTLEKLVCQAVIWRKIMNNLLTNQPNGLEKVIQPPSRCIVHLTHGLSLWIEMESRDL
jgi:hypothetical protein